jgi:DNA-binding transcriptional regulator YiaG
MTPDQLKDWRGKTGYSQNKLAIVLGVDVMTVSRWERGVSTIPSFLHLTLECVRKKKGGELRSRVLNKTERRKK